MCASIDRQFFYLKYMITIVLISSQLSDQKFDLELHDKSRTYHLRDNDGGSERWAVAISAFLEAEANYVQRKRLSV